MEEVGPFFILSLSLIEELWWMTLSQVSLSFAIDTNRSSSLEIPSGFVQSMD